MGNAGSMPAPRGPGILPGASKQKKLLSFPHSSVRRVLVLELIEKDHLIRVILFNP